MTSKRCRLLFVDDSRDDHVLFGKALGRLGLSVDLLTPLHDGDEAVAYLAGDGPYANRDTYPLPDLLVLDLKMPGKTGHDVLAWLQTHPFRPVTVVFSASERSQDISQVNARGVSNYFVKPGAWRQWIETVRAIAELCPQRGCAPLARQLDPATSCALEPQAP